LKVDNHQEIHVLYPVNKLVLVPDFDMFEHPEWAEVTVPDVPDGGDYFIASELVKLFSIVKLLTSAAPCRFNFQFGEMKEMQTLMLDLTSYTLPRHQLN
jgi:hypothetical protein